MNGRDVGGASEKKEGKPRPVPNPQEISAPGALLLTVLVESG
jgi:hypothetical protein